MLAAANLMRIGGTRTCIHTPGAAYAPEDLDQTTIQQALDNTQLVYFDGRLTDSALVLAKAARQQGVPILVEAERLRPNLEALLLEADYVCTSAHFPQVRQNFPHVWQNFPQAWQNFPQVWRNPQV